MKLSEAIREGAKETQPGTQALLYVHKGKPYACALGAALVGKLGWNDAYKQYGPRKSVGFSMPIEHEFPEVPEGMPLEVVFKNDDERQSREQIADWLESEGL